MWQRLIGDCAHCFSSELKDGTHDIRLIADKLLQGDICRVHLVNGDPRTDPLAKCIDQVGLVRCTTVAFAQCRII